MMFPVGGYKCMISYYDSISAIGGYQIIFSTYWCEQASSAAQVCKEINEA